MLVYILMSNKMQRYTVYFICLHVSGGKTTQNQERKKLYLHHLVFVTQLPLPAAIVEELERSYHPKHVDR
jgi:hypothetical protein